MLSLLKEREWRRTNRKKSDRPEINRPKQDCITSVSTNTCLHVLYLHPFHDPLLFFPCVFVNPRVRSLLTGSPPFSFCSCEPASCCWRIEPAQQSQLLHPDRGTGLEKEWQESYSSCRWRLRCAVSMGRLPDDVHFSF